MIAGPVAFNPSGDDTATTREPPLTRPGATDGPFPGSIPGPAATTASLPADSPLHLLAGLDPDPPHMLYSDLPGTRYFQLIQDTNGIVSLTKPPAASVRSTRGRPAAWPYRADPPQRYWGNYGRYIQRGGLVDLEEDIQGFVAGGNVGDISRFYFFCLVFDQIRKDGLEGDLAELGVYRGQTAGLIARMARRLGRTAFLLDTFEGFDQSDLGGIDADKEIQFTDTSLEAVKAAVGEDSVKFVKGHFPGTATEIPETSFCLAHIDCDLYAPILSSLEYFYPRLVPGGFLIIHDYSSLAWDGAERAVDTFFADKPEAIIPLTDGAGSVVIRRARQPNSQPAPVAQKRLALFPDHWTPAGQGQLADDLVEGWGGQEAWGVWGIGSQHKLRLYLPERPDDDFFLDIDVHAPLSPGNPEHRVDVSVDGRDLGTLIFNSSENRGVRSIAIPRDIVPAGTVPSITVQFRPHQTVRPVDHNPAGGDFRELGLALHRIRLRLP
jgi:hypothetical protein